MEDVSVLEREVYGMTEAAHLLGLRSASTLRNWIDGYRHYPPVIRPERTGSDLVKWGEFVEAGYLAEYRHKHRVPLQRLRPAIIKLRDLLGVPYPLAHSGPFLEVANRELVLRVQDEIGLSGRAAPLVVVRNGQMILADPAQSFVDKVDFSESSGIVERLYPLDKRHAVVMDPLISSGAPAVKGIRTENLYELFQADESVVSIAAAYDLDPHEVEAAIRFESRSVA
jgi:uncharacterized protein (DUF433 family)